MTNDNNTRKKANAVFFSVIMVISMAAIGFAAAPAAAATDAENVEITYNEPDGDTAIANGTAVTPNVTISVASDADENFNQTNVEDGENISFLLDGAVADSKDFTGVDIAPGASEDFEFTDVDTTDLDAGEYEHQVALVDEDDGIVEDANGVAYASETLTLTVDELDDFEDRDFDRNFQNAAGLSDSLVYSGQTVSVGIDDAEGDDEVQLRRTTDTGSTAVSTLTVREDSVGEYVNFNTANRQTADYFLRGAGFNQTNSEFELVEQDLDAEFDPDEVDNAGSDTTSDLTIDSDLRNTYDVFLSIDGLDEEDDYEFILENSQLASGASAEFDEDEEAVRVMNAEGVHEIDFDDVAADEYDLNVDVVDTTAEDVASITVNEVGEGDVSFEDSFITDDQGDIAEITIEFDGDADEAFLRVGDEEDVGYEANITVTANGEESVTVGFNTYTAGDESFDEEEFVTVVDEDSDADVDLVNQSSLGSILATGTYTMDLSDEGHDEIADDNAVDVGDFEIEERGVQGFQLWTTSQDAFDDVEDADDILAAAEDGTVQQTETLAGDDILVHDLEATGLEGLFEVGADDAAFEEEDGFVGTLTDFDSDNGTDLRIRQTRDTTAPNQDRKVVNTTAMIENGDISVIANDDRYFIAFAADDIVTQGDRDVEDGDAFNVRLRVKDERLLNVDEDELEDADDDLSEFYEVATATFTYEDAEGEFDEPIEVEAAEEQSITGTSNVAPGQELTIRVRSASGVSPGFVLSDNEVTIDSDGTFEATLDFSDASVGDEFTATVRQATFDASEDGVVVEGVDDEDDVDETDDADDVDETDDADDVDETDDADDVDETDDVDDADDVDDTEDDTPGFGALVALVALIAAALLATRRTNN